MDDPVGSGHGVDHLGPVGDIAYHPAEVEGGTLSDEPVAAVVGTDVEGGDLRSLVEQQAHRPRADATVGPGHKEVLGHQ